MRLMGFEKVEIERVEHERPMRRWRNWIPAVEWGCTRSLVRAVNLNNDKSLYTRYKQARTSGWGS